jgi:hypothetical protein
MLIFHFKGLRVMSVITEHGNIVNKNKMCILDDSHLGTVKHDINPFL